ncbi:hypothetical protein H0H87_002871 [Tephrocybe sp. NHM501043]|nr:hypothetical protein H0H87_002871 [Tephrocybe sp. NHM501043]
MDFIGDFACRPNTHSRNYGVLRTHPQNALSSMHYTHSGSEDDYQGDFIDHYAKNIEIKSSPSRPERHNNLYPLPYEDEIDDYDDYAAVDPIEYQMHTRRLDFPARFTSLDLVPGQLHK